MAFIIKGKIGNRFVSWRERDAMGVQDLVKRFSLVVPMRCSVG
jgi:hypothetical protein